MKIRSLSIVLLTLAVVGISACNKQEAAAPAEAPVVEAAPVETAPMEGAAMQGDAAGEMGMEGGDAGVDGSEAAPQ